MFSRNRLNVAVSRAMCLAFVVASPRLLESRARTIEQMRLSHDPPAVVLFLIDPALPMEGRRRGREHGLDGRGNA